MRRERPFFLRTILALLVGFAVSGCAANADERPESQASASTSRVVDTARGGATAGMLWLQAKSEDELAALFARGRADSVPLGQNSGMPLLPGASSALLPLAEELYQGSLWNQDVGPDGTPLFLPNGDPVVELADAFVRKGDGSGVVSAFHGRVTRGRLADVRVGEGISPPTGSSPPFALSPYTRAIEIDGAPSLFVDYHEDPTPFVNRILDEIREVDPARCPGLYLGRAHFLDAATLSRWSYLYYFTLDFVPEGRTCDLT